MGDESGYETAGGHGAKENGEIRQTAGLQLLPVVTPVVEIRSDHNGRTGHDTPNIASYGAPRYPVERRPGGIIAENSEPGVTRHGSRSARSTRSGDAMR